MLTEPSNINEGQSLAKNDLTKIGQFIEQTANKTQNIWLIVSDEE